MIAEHTKSFDFQSVRIFFEWTENEEVLILPATLLLISCLCKGAQFPFSKWLLDATVADTYISILLHSVTVVWTGIIFIYKCHFIFERIEFFGEALVFIGGATAIIMALCSLFQVDMKKIIACSTAASIGIAFVACGIKAYDISIIYFICHAFSKSVFFLSVAYIMHIVSKETNILKMGGISKIAPNVNDIICVSFISTIGFPCFVNFFAKASLLQMTLDIKIILIVITNSVLLMIAFWRLIYLAMYGNSRMDERTMSRVSDLQGSCIIPPWLLLFFAVIGSFASIGMYNMEINYIKQSLFEILQIMIAISIIVILKHRYKKLMPAKIEQVFRDNELSEYFFSFLYTCLVQVQKFFLVIDRKFDNFIHKALQTSTEFLSVSVYKLYKESIENQTRWLFLGIATCIMCAIACSMIH
jgi:NADH:ubiquinone oxidoreductase subunit 5 (subunit L)/multisubunit Na+/H+ antiporter MnhA subunit